jgi:hypothetical protein
MGVQIVFGHVGKRLRGRSSDCVVSLSENWQQWQPTKRHVGQKQASDKMTWFSRAKAGFMLVLNGLWINLNVVSVDSSR